MIIDYKVSVIVPVYNGKKFIVKCIENLLNQTYKNIEIIIVNDGSTDNTESILQKYHSNSKIKVYNNENHGPSYSRNYGIKKATGEYIMFMDIDDELVSDGIEKIMKIASANPNFDIIRYNGYEEKEDKTRIELESVENYNYIKMDKKSIFDLFISSKNFIRGYCWLLLLKRNNIVPFKENLKYMEDTIFSIENILEKKNINFVDEYIYIYKYNANSITKQTQNLITKLKYLIKTYETMEHLVNDLDDGYKDKVKNYFIKLLIRKICSICRIVSFRDFKNTCNNIYSDKKLIEFLNFNPKYIDSTKIRIIYKLFIRKKINLIYMINKLKMKI